MNARVLIKYFLAAAGAASSCLGKSSELQTAILTHSSRVHAVSITIFVEKKRSAAYRKDYDGGGGSGGGRG